MQPPSEDHPPPPEEVLAALARMGLRLPPTPTSTRLTGGVASDIWRLETRDGPICVKRALARLRVAADWRAPVERNLYEARWMQRAARAAPGAVPNLIGQDPAAGVLAMQYLPQNDYPLWKTELAAANVVPAFAAQVGTTLVRIHAATAADPTCPADFPTDRIFFDIRLAPYLLATAARHPDRAEALQSLVRITQSTPRALVHGDISPKNILRGPSGPVFLDAECAWWGDPAFDLAFCLNHLLLKCLLAPTARPALLDAFADLARHYLAGVDWEPPAQLEARAAALLPGLFLARVDGKSPVEYLGPADQHRVREAGRAWLAQPTAHLTAIADAWKMELSR